jgi:hypothetical protein
MSAVYVFGAGASIHANYPLASKMGQGLLEFMLKSENNDFQVSAEQLIEIFGTTPNIEDLISEIEARIDALKSRKTDEELVKWVILTSGRSNILRALREWFRVLHCSPADLYENFSQKIANAGDTVITFNYDDSLDRELRRAGKWELSTGYGFPFGNAAIPSAVQLLKVHGSSNWIVSLGGGIRSGFTFVGSSGFMGGRPVIHTVDAEYLGYENFSGNTYPGGGTELSMILPGRILSMLSISATRTFRGTPSLSSCRKLPSPNRSLGLSPRGESWIETSASHGLRSPHKLFTGCREGILWPADGRPIPIAPRRPKIPPDILIEHRQPGEFSRVRRTL